MQRFRAAWTVGSTRLRDGCWARASSCSAPTSSPARSSRPSGPRRWAIRSPAWRGRRRRRRRGRAADRPLPADRRRGARRGRVPQVRRLPQCQPGRRQRPRPEPVGHDGRPRRAPRRLRLFRRAAQPWRPLGLGHDERLAAQSPRTFAPGTKMTFAGLSDPQDRADLMLYLNQHGGTLTIPPPPAAARRPSGNDGRRQRGRPAMPPSRQCRGRGRAKRRRRRRTGRTPARPAGSSNALSRSRIRRGRSPRPRPPCRAPASRSARSACFRILAQIILEIEARPSADRGRRGAGRWRSR